jgi:hypothetical protein
LNAAILTTGDSSYVLHDSFRGFSLTRTRFPGDDDALVFMIRAHVVVCGFRYTENMRWDFKPVFASVLLQYLIGIDAKI